MKLPIEMENQPTTADFKPHISTGKNLSVPVPYTIVRKPSVTISGRVMKPIDYI